MRKFTRGFIALFAALAFTAVFANAASAALFHSEVKETELTGTAVVTNEFEVTNGKVRCTVANFSGKVIATGGSGANNNSPSVKVHATYTSCTSFGQTTTIDTAGCNYVITPSTATTGRVSIECEAGKFIHVTVGDPKVVCSITIGSQTPFNNAVDFSNGGSGTSRDVLVTATVGLTTAVEHDGQNSGITYTSTAGICGAGGNEDTYRGTITTKGYSDKEHKPRSASGSNRSASLTRRSYRPSQSGRLGRGCRGALLFTARVAATHTARRPKRARADTSDVVCCEKSSGPRAGSRNSANVLQTDRSRPRPFLDRPDRAAETPARAYEKEKEAPS